MPLSPSRPKFCVTECMVFYSVKGPLNRSLIAMTFTAKC